MLLGMQGLEQTLVGVNELVFVCSGNMVRSAFAELYARHRGIAIPVSSLATTYRNDGLFPETRAALLARGVSEVAIDAFQPTHVDDCKRSFGPGELALVMTQQHRLVLSKRFPRAELLNCVLGSEDGILDPVLEGASFEATFRRIAACVDVLTLHFTRPA